MMDCKKALQESDGDFEKAMESLKKKGLASANKNQVELPLKALLNLIFIWEER